MPSNSLSRSVDMRWPRRILLRKEDLKRKADIAIYSAKARDRDGFQWFE
ncbi:hypothetical protein [Sodalis sp.]